jgi:glycosyltransferase involved in cell wall biosynthesis
VRDTLARTLYLCYFGLREPLVQTQVLPYLRELVAGGIEVFLLTFEPQLAARWKADELETTRARLAGEGIRWHYLPYHKQPTVPATAYDIAQGARLAARLVRQYDIQVLHARAHIPLAMALIAQRARASCRLVFDIRGLMAEEYADAGIWTPSSAQFRAVKRLERAGIRRADQIVVLTERMRDWLVEHKLKRASEIEVIPCCVDFSRFDEEAATGEATGEAAEEASGEAREETAAAGERFEVVYAGSVTGLYLLEEMGRFFLKIRERRARAFLRIMTQSSSEEAAARLISVGLQRDDFSVGAVAPSEVPAGLRRARLGLSFRKPTFSQLAASPTKVPEYLAAGLPVVCNAGIGDTDDLLNRERVGVIIESFDEESLSEAADKALALTLEPLMGERARRAARVHFDLSKVGGTRYRNLYRRLEEQGGIRGAIAKIPFKAR